jgi:hypothetical protein
MAGGGVGNLARVGIESEEDGSRHPVGRNEPCQAAGDLDCTRRGEVQEYALLSLIPLIEISRAVEARLHAGRRNRQPARSVGPCLRLEADDLGAEVGELHRAEWARPDPAEVDDAHARERKWLLRARAGSQ